jgi:arginyl-tRNA synthetase
VLPQIEATLERFGVRFDSFFRESELAAKGEIEAAVQRLRDAGAVYEHEGALWFRSTQFGDDKDRVLVRSNGQHTYFGADAAYIVDKFSRGYDHLIYVLGADHHGDVARLKGAARAMGYDPDALELLIYQWVSFMRDGEPVPMSKRSGDFISLDQLLDEVGVDATRFHLLLFSNDAAINFDIEAVKRRSMDNPVFYVQYGHARIASILAKASREGVTLLPIEQADLTLLGADAETNLLRGLADVPALIAYAAELRAPHRVAHAAQDLAALFHRFYTGCKVVSDDPELTQARLWLAVATKQVLANLLDLLGVSAPESMERTDDDA